MTSATDAFDIAPEFRPRHIAIIMDGNGRWALERNEPRNAGHRRGADSVREVVTTCAELGLAAVTLYCFSSENWKRPIEEVNALMTLYLEFLEHELPTMLENDIRFRQIGHLDGLPDEVIQLTEHTTRATADCKGLDLVLALNYGSRTEITDAVRAISEKTRSGALDPGDITEQTVSDHLYTAGIPDPDLLIRTAGEMRISNYLLWQISYAEFYVTQIAWPEFGRQELYEAIRDYARRDRRFGAVPVPGDARDHTARITGTGPKLPGRPAGR